MGSPGGQAPTPARLARLRAAVSVAGRDVTRVLRFLQGHVEFQVRPDDIFISSYPRSGTTWLQQALLVLARDAEPECAHISEQVPWFERSLALNMRRASSFHGMTSPRIFKSHLPHGWLPAGARYIYALRDGRDVAVSYYHLYCTHLGYTGDFDAFFARFMRGDLQYKSWFKHAAGWQALSARPDVLIVRYEDMHRDLRAVMRELNAFCGFRRSDARIDELATFCTFSYMKQYEDRFDHATDRGSGPHMKRGAFVRRGATGGYTEYLSEAQRMQFEAERARPVRGARLELDLPAFLH